MDTTLQSTSMIEDHHPSLTCPLNQSRPIPWPKEDESKPDVIVGDTNQTILKTTPIKENNLQHFNSINHPIPFSLYDSVEYEDPIELEPEEEVVEDQNSQSNYQMIGFQDCLNGVQHRE